jgi:hypothetical protein
MTSSSAGWIIARDHPKFGAPVQTVCGNSQKYFAIAVIRKEIDSSAVTDRRYNTYEKLPRRCAR